MKRLLYCACIAVTICCIRCTPVHNASIAALSVRFDSSEKTERYWFSAKQEFCQKYNSIRTQSIYVEWYVNGAQYTEISDTATFADAVLVAELKPSQRILVGKICPCSKPLLAKAL